MDKIVALVEQQAREAASHLRHIDELIALAHSAPDKDATAVAGLLQPIEKSRHLLARDLDAFEQSSSVEGHDLAATGVGLTGALKALGLELEQVLAGIFDSGK